jgi:hypothetical protein
MEKQPQFYEEMKKAGSEAVPLEQRETEDPPPLPKLSEGDTEAQVNLRTSDSPEDAVSFSIVQSSLWPEGSQTPQVILVPAPTPVEESVAFGLCELVATNNLWEVAFVARMKNTNREAFKAGLPSSIPVDEYTTPPQTSLQNYLQRSYGITTTYMVAADLLKGSASNNGGYFRAA